MSETKLKSALEETRKAQQKAFELAWESKRQALRMQEANQNAREAQQTLEAWQMTVKALEAQEINAPIQEIMEEQKKIASEQKNKAKKSLFKKLLNDAHK